MKAHRFKRCPRCGEHRRLADFGLDGRMALGHRSWCRECEQEDWAMRRAGVRPMAPREQDYPTAAVFVCLCDVAVVDHTNAGACRCGFPIVSRMHPDSQAIMAEKYPPIFDQTVIDPAAEQATA